MVHQQVNKKMLLYCIRPVVHVYLLFNVSEISMCFTA